MRRDVVSLVMARLDQATNERHATAAADRLALLTGDVTPGRCCPFLLRVFGFEVQVDASLHVTRRLSDVIDQGARRPDLIFIGDVARAGLLSACGEDNKHLLDANNR